MVCAGQIAGADAVPAGTEVEVRLNTGIHSYSSRAGDLVTASLIAPVAMNGQVLIPPGSTLRGQLTEVRRVGWGFRQYASVRVNFDQLEFPDGTTRPVHTRLRLVDNAREKVDSTGRVVGIRATSAMGFRLAGITRNIFLFDPLIQGVLALSTTVALRFPEAEINFHPGTEMMVALTADLAVERDWPWSVPLVAANPEEERTLRDTVRKLTWRSVSPKERQPADVTNILLIGDPEWIERAFAAAGWVEADRLSMKNGYMTFRSVAENSPYPKAPMSKLLLDERSPRYEFSKALNNYSKRHHLRIWPQAEAWKGRTVYSAAATQDIAITFLFSTRKITHIIDRNIDNERAKVVSDLVYTGCVDAAELMDRAWVPRQLRGPMGSLMDTDGAIAVLELNPCRDPQRFNEPSEGVKFRPGIWKRTPRNVMLTLGNDLTFNNPLVQAGKGVQFLWKRAAKSESWPTFVRANSIPKSAREPALPTEVTPD